MRLLFIFVLFSFCTTVGATVYTRCKVTHPDYYPDVFCFEDKGFHSKKYCAKESRKIFDTPMNVKVKRVITDNVIISELDPYWENCSAVYLDGRCFLYYGQPCI